MKLPEIQARVIYERYAQEKPFSEIGEKIGKTEANCRKIHQRALESLRQLIHASDYYLEYEPDNTKKGRVSLENDDSSREENAKEAEPVAPQFHGSEISDKSFERASAVAYASLMSAIFALARSIRFRSLPARR